MGEITKLCQRHGMEALSVRLIEDGASIEKARAIILDELAERDAKAPTLPRIELQRDETDTRRAAMENVILHRAGHSRLDDNGRRFVGLSLLEMARKSLDAQGIKHEGVDKMIVAGRALHGTGDFPEILANVATKTLRAAYQARPRTFVPWTRQNSAVDFKQISRTQLGDAPTLKTVNENGEFTYGTMGEGVEKYQLRTYGRIIGLTRQAIVNDELDAFARILPGFGIAAADLESDTVYGILNSNPNMADGVPLFHTASHGNLAGTNAAISVAALGIGRAAMRKQTGINGSPINVAPSFLIVPAELETIAQQFVSTAHMPDPSSNINPFAGTLQVIAESRLSVATSWFLAASPAQIDTIEYSYLEGNEGVYLETRNGFEVDGIEIKARLDFAAKAIDWRGLWKNVGT
jgi:phage major head subunit gpT-like protein